MRRVDFEPTNGRMLRPRMFPRGVGMEQRPQRRFHAPTPVERRYYISGEPSSQEQNDNATQYPVSEQKILGMRPRTVALAITVTVIAIALIHFSKRGQNVAEHGVGIE